MIENQNQQEETIDIKALILKYSQYWYFFFLSILFFTCLAFLNNRLTVPEYSVSTTLLIRDDNNTQLGAENLLEGLELFSGKQNIKNEIVILNSYSSTEKVIRELGLGLSYYQHGFFQTNELFENSPITVKLDSNHNQITGTIFKIEILNENEFRVSATTDDLFPYNLITEKFDKTLLANIHLDGTYKFNEEIKSEYYSFAIKKSIFFNLDKIKKRKTELFF
jgi:uncharacterized protein involved in exopolysaccharide biosynthesis